MYERAQITVYQAAFLLLSEKRKGKMRDGVFDRLCRLLHDVVLPKGNLFPRSYFLMKRAVNAMLLEKVTYHVCMSDYHIFSWVPERDWKEHADDQCHVFRKARFIRDKNGGLKPAKVFYYFGLVSCIRSLFENPTFVKLRATKRDEDPFFSSIECARLYAAASKSKQDLSCLSISIGLDWAQMYKYKM